MQERQGDDIVILWVIDVYEKFGLFRFFRRGAAITAFEKEIDEFTIKLVNRWQQYKRVRGGHNGSPCPVIRRFPDSISNGEGLLILRLRKFLDNLLSERAGHYP